ncbi:hypothetical protein KO529_03930 [Arenibacter algicola]|uniref:hypothetical protein n=1 Tax=Arenibacter algicola TaxID=616991 RepID=UPI001C06A73C|nr:hypothetical protein [Arenibacter algicola]MBU2903923.1 hypothetical protein [Arenibacter algicola]
MIIDTTHRNNDTSLLINDLVGKPFSFIKTIKMKGTVSKKMVIEESSENMKDYLNSIFDATYANIELRPLGILVGIIKGFTNFTWVIPYYQLVIYKGDYSSLYAQGRFIRFRKDESFDNSKPFLHKLIKLKARYESKYDFLNFK